MREDRTATHHAVACFAVRGPDARDRVSERFRQRRRGHLRPFENRRRHSDARKGHRSDARGNCVSGAFEVEDAGYSQPSRMVLCEPSNSKSAPDAIRRGGDRGADRYSRHWLVDSQCVSDLQPGATRCHAGQRSRHSPRGAIGLRAERCRDGPTSPRQGPSVAALPQHRIHLFVERRQTKSLRSRSHVRFHA